MSRENFLCALKAFAIMAGITLLFVGLYHFTHAVDLNRWLEAILGATLNQWINIVGYWALGALLGVGFVRASVAAIASWPRASWALRTGFIATILIWLAITVVMPLVTIGVGENFSNIGTLMFLFTTPGIVCFVVWSVIDNRPYPTPLHKFTGSLFMGLVPAGFVWMTPFFVDTTSPSIMTIASIAFIIGILLIPAVLAYIFGCDDDTSCEIA